MDRTKISEQDEAQFLEIRYQELLEDDRAKLPWLFETFKADLEDQGVLGALVRVTDRLSPYEAVLLALSALSNAAHGAKLGVRIIRGAQKVELAEYVVRILGTAPIPDDHRALPKSACEAQPNLEMPF